MAFISYFFFSFSWIDWSIDLRSSNVCACCLCPWLGLLPAPSRNVMYFRFWRWRHTTGPVAIVCIPKRQKDSVTAETIASILTKFYSIIKTKYSSCIARRGRSAFSTIALLIYCIGVVIWNIRLLRIGQRVSTTKQHYGRYRFNFVLNQNMIFFNRINTISLRSWGVMWSDFPVLLARGVMYTSRAYATMSVSVCPSVCDVSALWSRCMPGIQRLR